jgi:hypothetical protein
MSFYRLSELNFTAPYFSAIDCVLNTKEAIYCSSEITSGWNLFNAMRSHKVNSTEALKSKLTDAWYQKNIVGVNSELANDFARIVRDAQRDHTPVITPAPLMVPDWNQPEYLAFWEEIIRTRVKAVRFNNNWEYSNGCTFEIAVALDANVATLDLQGAPISASAVITRMRNAIQKIKGLDRDFDTSKLERNMERVLTCAAIALPPKVPPTGTKTSRTVTRKSRTA